MRKLFSIFAMLALAATVSYAQSPNVPNSTNIEDGEDIEITDIDLSSDSEILDDDFIDSTDDINTSSELDDFKAEPIIEPEPVVIPEPVVEAKPTEEETPAVQETPIVESTPVAEPELVVIPEPEPVVEPEPVIEAVPAEETIEEIIEEAPQTEEEVLPVESAAAETYAPIEYIEEKPIQEAPVQEDLATGKMKGIHPFKKNKCLNDKDAHFSIALEGGIALLDGDFMQPNVTILPWTRVQPQAGISLTYDFTPVWSLSAVYNYAMYGVKKLGENRHEWVLNGRMHTAQLMVNFDVIDAWIPKRTTNIFSLYLIGGVGFGIYNSTYQENNIFSHPREDGRDAITGLFSIGAAAEFNLGRLTSLGVKGLYHFYTTDNLDTRIEGPNNDCMEYASAYLRFKVGGVKRNHQRNFSSEAFLQQELDTKNPARVQKQREAKAAEDARIDKLIADALNTALKDSTVALRDSLLADSAFVARYIQSIQAKHPYTRNNPDATQDIDIEALYHDGEHGTNRGGKYGSNRKASTGHGEVMVISDEQVAKAIRENMEIIRLKTSAQNYFVYFKNNSNRLTEEGLQVVQQAADFAKNNPEICYALVGYCDNTGTERINKRLAQRRADRVMKELTEVYDIDEERLFSLGKGRLDNVNSSYAPNRRVELIICSKSELEDLRKASETPEDIVILTIPETEEISVETPAEEVIEEEVEVVTEAPTHQSVPSGELAELVLAERETLITVTSTSITTFARLARKYYKNVSCWPFIYAANRHIIVKGSPDLIPIGVQVAVPQLTQAEIDIATPETEAEMAAIVSQTIK